MGEESTRVTKTPALGKPFRRVKVLTRRSIVQRDGELELGQYSVYLDPRGRMGFAIGIPNYVGELIGSEFGAKKAGDVWYVKGETAKDAEEAAYSAMSKYREEYAHANREEVIVYSFEGVAPRFDEMGDDTDEFIWKEANHDYGGRTETKIEFDCRRAWKIGDDFYRKDTYGEFRRLYNHSGITYVPYTPELWAQLVAIRETLARACAMLGSLFESRDVPAKLLGLHIPLMLEPPKERKRK